MRRLRALGVGLWALGIGMAVPAAAQQPTVTEVTIEQEGRPITDRLIAGLIETRVGEPLSMRAVRETITHLMSLNRFEDVQPFSEPVAGGVRVRYVLFPVHAVDRIDFRGAPGLPEGDLRRVITERFGAAPPAGRAMDVAQLVRQHYRDRGFPNARVVATVEETHDPDRATMVLDVNAGARALIARVDFEQVDQVDRNVFLAQPEIRQGQPYDAAAVARELERYQNSLRARGYYEARAVHAAEFTPDGMAVVAVSVERGPLVSVAFAGDPLPENERERLVPVRAEGSADEDLLEDAAAAIRGYLYERGYRAANVNYTRDPRGDELVITFTIKRGRRHIVDSVAITGNAAVTEAELRQVLALETGEPFVAAALDAGAASIRNIYRSRGFTRVLVQAAPAELPAKASRW